MILPEDVYVSVTADGYIKRISQRSYKASENTPLGKKDDDHLLDLFYANTLDKLLVFTDLGNYLFIPIHKLEEFKWKELGKHISYLIKLSPDEKIIGSILVKNFQLPLHVVLASQMGQIKRVNLSDFEVTRFSKPIKCMNLKKDDSLLNVGLTDGHQGIVLTSQMGYVTLYSEEDISLLGMKAGGIKGINLKNDILVSMNTFNPLKSLSYVLVSDQPGIKRLHIADIPNCNRATKGTMIYKSPKTNSIHTIASYILDTQDNLKMITDQQTIDIAIKDYNYSQIGTKPSVIVQIKNEVLKSIYQQKALSTDQYMITSNAIKKDVVKDHNNEDDIVLNEREEDTRNSVIIEKKTIKKSKKKEQVDKHFEPISFDDLFKDDF